MLVDAARSLAPGTWLAVYCPIDGQNRQRRRQPSSGTDAPSRCFTSPQAARPAVSRQPPPGRSGWRLQSPTASSDAGGSGRKNDRIEPTA